MNENTTEPTTERVYMGEVPTHLKDDGTLATNFIFIEPMSPGKIAPLSYSEYFLHHGDSVPQYEIIALTYQEEPTADYNIDTIQLYLTDSGETGAKFNNETDETPPDISEVPRVLQDFREGPAELRGNGMEDTLNRKIHHEIRKRYQHIITEEELAHHFNISSNPIKHFDISEEFKELRRQRQQHHYDVEEEKQNASVLQWWLQPHRMIWPILGVVALGGAAYARQEGIDILHVPGDFNIPYVEALVAGTHLYMDRVRRRQQDRANKTLYQNETERYLFDWMQEELETFNLQAQTLSQAFDNASVRFQYVPEVAHIVQKAESNHSQHTPLNDTKLRQDVEELYQEFMFDSVSESVKFKDE